MANASCFRLGIISALIAAAPAAATAWNPYPFLSNPPPATYQPVARHAVTPVEPPVHYAPAVVQPPAYSPPPAPAVTQYAAPPPIETAYVAPPPVALTDVPSPVVQDYTPPMTVERHAVNEGSFGVEGFYDRYQEPVVDLDSRAEYGSLTGDYAHYFENHAFAGIDGRVSYGRDHYKSISGQVGGIPQWEFESRLRGGYSFLLGNGRLEPYAGVGTRFYYDNFKGSVTDTGGSGYDRRILQFYVPIGLTYRFAYADLNFKPNFEFDPLLLGKVNSRLGTFTGFENVTNTQHNGFGLRGEFMLGRQQENGKGWEAGPFVRYWNFRDSDPSTDSFGNTWIEPHNTRMQVGAALRMTF